tara:strand:- start:461 stop:1774 length:1314 start_codon:yes stop_codon:yes gene_type:complete
MSNLIFIKDNDNNVGIGSNMINDIKGNINITQNLNVSGNLNVINDVTINARLGIGTTSNRITLDVGGTDGIIIPAGTEALRPANPIPGTIRYNSDTYNFEGYSGWDGGQWLTISTRPFSTSPLYTFTSVTFTNCGATGRIGPTLAQMRSALSGYTWANEFLNMASGAQGVQKWTVPQSGTYEINVYGARGRGSYGNYDTGYYGKGARMKGQFYLNKSEIIQIVVGQEGALGDQGPGANEMNFGGSGGGGSFVFTGTTPLIIAGGGGGGSIINVVAPNLLSETIGIDGQITTAATLFNYDSSKSSTFGSWYVANNGANGGHWTVHGSSNYTTDLANGGGRGWTDAISYNGAYGPYSGTFVGGPQMSAGITGGFGGGNATINHGGGGAGGYSGGASADLVLTNLWRTGGGGGGSYNIGSNQSNSPGVRDGHGQVIITLL